jgi:hypothetical protein
VSATNPPAPPEAQSGCSGIDTLREARPLLAASNNGCLARGRRTRGPARTYSARACYCWHTTKSRWYAGAGKIVRRSCGSLRCGSVAGVKARLSVIGVPAQATRNVVAGCVDIYTRTTTRSTTWLLRWHVDTGSGGAGAAAGAIAATALRSALTVLPGRLTLAGGSSLTDAQRCQRASYEGCSHQPKRPTSRDAAASQPASQFIEVAVGSFLAHLLPPSPEGGTWGSPAQLYNEDKYEGLQTLAQLPRIPLLRTSRVRGSGKFEYTKGTEGSWPPAPCILASTVDVTVLSPSWAAGRTTRRGSCRARRASGYGR